MLSKLIKIIAVFAATYILFSLGGYLESFLYGYNIDNAEFIAGTVVHIILIIGLVKLIYNDGLEKFFWKNNHHPFVYVVTFILIGLSFLALLDEPFLPSYVTDRNTLTFFTFELAIAAIFGEILCRVFLFGSVHMVLKGEEKSRILRAALISSLLFSLLYYLNLLTDMNNFWVITGQVFVAFGLGTMFCAIYVLSRNIYIPIIFHFLLLLLTSGLSFNLGSAISFDSGYGVTFSYSLNSYVMDTMILAGALIFFAICFIYVSNYDEFFEERLPA